MLEISTGVTSQKQGQYAYAVSGVNPDAGLRRRPEADGQAACSIPAFSPCRPTYYNNTPNLDIDLRRDQAKTYGVSEARILTLLRNAYSQNYLYLIKKPEDSTRSFWRSTTRRAPKPEDLSLLYIRSDDGKRLVPLSALVTWKTTLGPQAVQPPQSVHQRDALLQSEAGRGPRRCDGLHQQDRGGSRAADCARRASGRGARRFSEHRHESDDPDGAGGVRDVRDPGDPLRKLRAPADGALDAADGAGRRAVDALCCSARRRRSTPSSACSC